MSNDKVLARIYNLDYHDSKLIDPIINYVRDNHTSIFIGFRKGKITFYYKGRETISLILDSENIKIKIRDLFKAKDISSNYVKHNSLNEKAIESLSDYYNENSKSFNNISLKNLVDDNGDIILDKVIKIIKTTIEMLDGYYGSDEQTEEKTIQNKIACNYQIWNNSYLCIDQEYNEKSNNKQEKDESNVTGRYDLIFLQDVGNKIKLLFVELKSTRKASIDLTTGNVNHLFDMIEFIKVYKDDNFKTREIIENSIKFILERKNAFGYIEEVDFNKIDFDNPEYIIMYDVTTKDIIYEPKNLLDFKNIVKEELLEAKKIKLTGSINSQKKLEKNPVIINGISYNKKDIFENEELVKMIYNEFSKIKIVNEEFIELK